MRGRRVLVTGHTGFKGSWLCLVLNELGADVTGYALPPEGEDSHFVLLGLDRLIRHVVGDIRDDKKLQAVFDEARPEIVFHLAAQALVRYSYDEPKLTFDTNVAGSVNVLEAVRKSNTVRSFV
ncbi:MAG: NAD-dependent epimerase/dehydratase family protein, partial [Betaproteobacteria bacterium]|nr:NAD-dependent epimerase/dehydratase family protein [Betaproteobacteria bacterium]